MRVLNGVLGRSAGCKSVRPASIDREPRRPSTPAIQRLAGCVEDPPGFGKGRRQTKVSKCDMMHHSGCKEIKEAVLCPKNHKRSCDARRDLGWSILWEYRISIPARSEHSCHCTPPLTSRDGGFPTCYRKGIPFGASHNLKALQLLLTTDKNGVVGMLA